MDAADFYNEFVTQARLANAPERLIKISFFGENVMLGIMDRTLTVPRDHDGIALGIDFIMDPNCRCSKCNVELTDPRNRIYTIVAPVCCKSCVDRKSIN